MIGDEACSQAPKHASGQMHGGSEVDVIGRGSFSRAQAFNAASFKRHILAGGLLAVRQQFARARSRRVRIICRARPQS